MSENQKSGVSGIALASDWQMYTHWEADESLAFPNAEGSCILAAGEKNIFICTVNADGTPGTQQRTLTYTKSGDVPKFEELLKGKYIIWATLAPHRDKSWNMSRTCSGCLQSVYCIDCYCRKYRSDAPFRRQVSDSIEAARGFLRHTMQAKDAKQTTIEDVLPLPQARPIPRDEHGALDIEKVVPPTDWMKLLAYEMFKFEVSFTKKFRGMQDLLTNQILAQNDKIRETVSALKLERQMEIMRRRNGNTEAK